ncbi:MULTISPECIES: C40 family peptidase [Streptomyces]|uniref:NlpC/P60 family protein n=1 Tax=Streptomyces evansiae TaxID=3075535 RepID=A0ABU2R5G7_9ACTN|nr:MULTISPECIES: C40 family peptidase [unclassified Streptomyces]MDT0411943.1 NlpC/P60 family protein [Streptomyces sp. DSM 41979]MYQ58927.1 glycoside hydrolase [Streptomyces sp. SID4926]
MNRDVSAGRDRVRDEIPAGSAGTRADAPRPRRGGRRLLLSALAVVCAALAFSAPGSAFAAPPPEPGSSGVTSKSPGKELSNAELEAVRTRIDDLYAEAGRATDAYNAAEEKRSAQSDKVEALTAQVVRGEQRLADLRDRLAAAAIAQYRDQGGGLSVQQRLLLSDDPDDFLRAAELAKEGNKGSAMLLDQVRDTQRALTRDKKNATTSLHRLEKAEKDKDTARAEVRKEIKAAKLLESRLEEKERQRLLALEKAEAERAQARLLDTGVLPDAGAGADAGKDVATGTGASEQGAKAVAFASAQLGKPYVWAAEGPDSFDCSGLTSQAWAAAGRIIPRTSQEQWRQLQHVPLSQIRPGDLVIYHSDASHVGIYIGKGDIIHAPRPGRSVTVAGVGSMQILGAVRPDPEAAATTQPQDEEKTGKGEEKSAKTGAKKGAEKSADRGADKAGKGADKNAARDSARDARHGTKRDAPDPAKDGADKAGETDKSPAKG